MKKKNQARIVSLLRSIPLILCVLLIAAYLFSNGDFSIQKLLHFTPKNPVFAALFILFLYTIKSLSVIFPVIVLQAATGYVFPPLPAILLNTAGMLLSLLIPYAMGLFSGSAAIDKLEHKHPKIAAFAEKQKDHVFFINFFLRIISILPADVVSIYFGSLKTPLVPYLGGSLLGMLPGMIAVTLMGSSVTDPHSPMFILSAVGTVCLAIGSLIIYRVIQRKSTRLSKEQENASTSTPQQD